MSNRSHNTHSLARKNNVGLTVETFFCIHSGFFVGENVGVFDLDMTDMTTGGKLRAVLLQSQSIIQMLEHLLCYTT